MPGSQENSFEGVIAAFQQIVDSFRRIRPVAVEAESSIRDYASAIEQDPMIHLQRGGYPGWDGYGTYWYDNTGVHSNVAGICFVCKQSTQRIDIDLDTYFCNSAECNEQVRKDRAA